MIRMEKHSDMQNQHIGAIILSLLRNVTYKEPQRRNFGM
jgi:hypothetical protein